MIDRLVQSALVRRLAPLLVVGLGAASGAVFGIELGFLVVAGGALAIVIVLLWFSVQSLTGESPLTFEEALSMGAPSAEEEQKRAVLRALKDLEYERSVGKISAEDYKIFAARYRAEAKRLIQAVDDSLDPARREVEALLRDRLSKRPARRDEDAEAEPTAAKSAEKTEGTDAAETEASPKSAEKPERADTTDAAETERTDAVQAQPTEPAPEAQATASEATTADEREPSKAEDPA